GQKDEGAHHVKLRGFWTAAVSKNDAGPEDGSRHLRQKLPDHMLAEFLGTSVGIIVGAVPINGIVFRHDLILPFSRDCDRTHMAEAAKSVVMVHVHCEFHNFQRSP